MTGIDLAHPTPWSLTPDLALKAFGSSKRGLSADEVRLRLRRFGTNEVGTERPVPGLRILVRQFTNPLVLILIGASLISTALGQGRETAIILVVTILSGLLGFVQEYRSERALRSLRGTLRRSAHAVRGGKSRRVDARELVPGDLVEIELGGVIPADLRMIDAQDLEIDESTMTGESVPVPKTSDAIPARKTLPTGQLCMAFMGTHVVQGEGVGLVVRTGAKTQFGGTAALLSTREEETEFQKGMRSFGNFLLKITLALAGIAFAVLAITRGGWSEPLLFALALAVGVSPQLLPVVITINMSHGALLMRRKRVLVKRLIAIEDLGNADVFCTDKTGTLTVGTPRVRDAIDADGNPSTLPLAYAASCLDVVRGRATNQVDQALLDAARTPDAKRFDKARRVDMVAFDFECRRMSCIYQSGGRREIVTKGAVAEVLAACTRLSLDGKTSRPLTARDRKRIIASTDACAEEGYRTIAVARRPVDDKPRYGTNDERDLELLGFVRISDAPKETAKAALKALEALSTRIVVLTGDNELVTTHIADQLGFAVTGIMTGADIERLDDAQLQRDVERVNVFARITPEHKLRIINALKARGRTVGYMGDGVNDAPALRAADVGISFHDAVDVAKDAASVILLAKDLSVLADGIREGRRTFVRTRTYIYSTISSNFGNMLSVAASSFLLPFIPLLPAQILLLNLIGDIPMLSISTDRVAPEEIAKPLRWDIHRVSSFMFFFGGISSLADFATFGLLLFVAHSDIQLFRSAWFVESIFTELIVIFILRSRVTSFANPPGRGLVASFALALTLGFAVVMTGIGTGFDFRPLPLWLLGAITGIVAAYAILTELGKRAYYRVRDRAAS